MLFNQELCLSESISLFGLPCNHISQRNPLGIYGEDGIRIISIQTLEAAQAYRRRSTKGSKKAAKDHILHPFNIGTVSFRKWLI